MTPMLLASSGHVDLPSLPLWLEVSVMSLNCMFGAALARSRSVPIFGTILAGVLVGLGGGIFRDMMLGTEPVAIAQWPFLPFGVALAIVGGLAYGVMGRYGTVMLAVNALVLGTLVTIGAQRALSFEVPWLSAIFLGVITASFGGLLADNMAGQKATIAKQAHWVGSALVVGSVTFVLVSQVVSFALAVVLSVAVTASLRFFSQFLDWPSPTWPGESRGTENNGSGAERK